MLNAVSMHNVKVVLYEREPQSCKFTSSVCLAKYHFGSTRVGATFEVDECGLPIYEKLHNVYGCLERGRMVISTEQRAVKVFNSVGRVKRISALSERSTLICQQPLFKFMVENTWVPSSESTHSSMQSNGYKWPAVGATSLFVIDKKVYKYSLLWG